MLKRLSHPFNKNSETFHRYIAFTLAEVLIVLGIIGIVAAMTIPTLVNNYKKTYYVTSLKKFFSSFGTNMQSYMASQGCTTLQCTGLFSGPSDDAINNNIKDVLTTKMKITYQPQTYITSDLSYGGAFTVTIPYHTLDGMLFSIHPYSDCSNFSKAPDDAKLKNSCAQISVDINGTKAPNRKGLDIFELWLANNGGIYPWGGQDQLYAAPAYYFYYWKNDTTRCMPSADSSVFGDSCSGRIVEEGWQMKYNYCGEDKKCSDS